MLLKSSVVPAVVLFVAFLAASCGTPAAPSPPTPPKAPENPSAPPPPGPKTEYALTFMASPSCSLPTGIERRTYSATVEERLWPSGERGWAVSIDGPEMMQGSGYFAGELTGDRLDFDITYGYGYGVVEMIDQTKPLFFDGEAHATITDGRVFGTFQGRIALYDSLGTFRIYRQAPYDCSAADHKIEFVRR